MSNSVDEQYLLSLPEWLRKICERGFKNDAGLTADDIAKYFENAEYAELKMREYEAILRAFPLKWRDYHKREMKIGAEMMAYLVPGNPPGAPRKDTLADEASRLKKAGRSWAQVSIALNAKYGEGTTTRESVRNLVTRRRDKTE